jgi:hypothetical protein
MISNRDLPSAYIQIARRRSPSGIDIVTSSEETAKQLDPLFRRTERGPGNL